MLFRSRTPSFYNKEKNPIPNSVTTIENVTINNRKQALLIRGQDVNQPILLCCLAVLAWHKLDLFVIFRKP